VAAQSTSGNDTIYGTGGVDVINGGSGNDRLEGRGGDDIYQFDLGGGQDVIYDDAAQYSTVNDVLSFRVGITPDMVTINRFGNLNDLTLSINGTTDSVKIERQFYKYSIFASSEWNLVERISFADGSVWTIQDIRARILREQITGNADNINGFWVGETIAGG